MQQDQTNVIRTIHSRQKRGRLDVLFAVVVSGVIVTVSAFLLLNTFISRALVSDQEIRKTTISQMVTSRIQQFDQGLDMLASFMRLISPENLEGGQLADVIRAQKELSDGLTALFFVDGADLISDGAMKIYPQERSSLRALPAIIQKIQNGIIPPSSLDAGKAYLYSMDGIWQPVREHIKPDDQMARITYDQIAILYPVLKADGGRGYLLAVLPSRSLINDHWLYQDQNLSRFSMRGHDGQYVFDFYRVRFSGDPDRGQEPMESSRAVKVDFASDVSNILIQFVQNNDQKNAILGMIPYITLALGLGLTLLGSFYVYNNYKQSHLLLKMNRTLALKNMEMNAQVTERERLNQILRKNEREHRSILDSVSDIIFELDEYGHIMFVNETWQRVLEYQMDQAHEMTLFEIMSHHDAHEQKALFQIFVQGEEGVPYDVNVPLKTAFGTFRLMEIKFSMRRMDENKNMRVVGTITDVEESRRAQIALEEAEKRYRSIWENAPSGIYQMSPEGKILSANPAFARLFGYATPGEMMQDISDMNQQLFTSYKDRQILLRRVQQEGSVVNYESQSLRRDKNAFWLLESVRVVRDDAGQIIYYEGSVDDVTQRKEGELKLKDAILQSEMANRSKTEFLANMSHELRTPLNAIIGFSEIIKDQIYGALDEKYQGYARDIHDSGRNLLSIINTILDVARIEAGERQLNETMINMSGLVHGVIDLVRPKAAANEQRLQSVIPGSLPRLLGEEQAVRQILMNLLSNAIKFTPSQGQITIKVDVQQNGDMVLSVSDTGVGLDDEEVARVMAPFGLASGSFARSSSGPGLGLTLVNSLTKLHGGRFEMMSQKGVGTTAMVVFPSVRTRPA
jgi:PAS domain S-box-containing protein